MAEGQSTTVPAVEYRDIPGYPGYRAGSDGTVWKVTPTGMKQIPQGKNAGGYMMVNLRRDKRGILVGAHRLVILAFRGPPNPGEECRHFPDRNPANNRIENLVWGTRSQNQLDRHAQGTMREGERHGRAKLTTEQVREIRLRAAAGESYYSLARAYGVTGALVRRIVLRMIWKCVA